MQKPGLTAEQRQEVIQLLREGTPPEEIVNRFGCRKESVSAHQAHVTRGTYDAEEEITGEAPLSFEKDLQASLLQDIASIEPGLKLHETAREHRTPAGLIDILAVNRADELVAIELKAGVAGSAAVGQLLGYMGALSQSSGGRAVKGYLVAHGFSESAKAAARLLPDVKLKTYRSRFLIEDAD